MNKYVNGNNISCMIGYNTDTNEVTILDGFHFDYIWIVPEDGEYSITKKDGTTENVKVSKGDLIAKTYKLDDKTFVYAVISDKAIKEHIAKMQDEKHKISSTFSKCECVSNVSSN